MHPIFLKVDTTYFLEIQLTLLLTVLFSSVHMRMLEHIISIIITTSSKSLMLLM
jgi:hypothetical protein